MIESVLYTQTTLHFDNGLVIWAFSFLYFNILIFKMKIKMNLGSLLIKILGQSYYSQPKREGLY
jgi:hypothetical protein